MRILVAYASKHGSTAQVAERIAAILAEGHTASDGTIITCQSVDDDPCLDGVDALVLGGAVYAGAWPKPAASFVDRVVTEAPGLPSWTFSCSLSTDPQKSDSRLAQALATASLLSPRDHALFGGVIDRSKLSLIERGVVTALRVPDGDYRDWSVIEKWANGVAVATSKFKAGT